MHIIWNCLYVNLAPGYSIEKSASAIFLIVKDRSIEKKQKLFDLVFFRERKDEKTHGFYLHNMFYIYLFLKNWYI